MRRITFLIAALLLPLAGCLGIPEGSVAPGDSVVANVVVRDMDTGEILLENPQLQFVAGSGTTGLGFEFERRLVGMAQGEHQVLRIANDPSLSWDSEVAVEGVFEDDLVGSIDVAQFQQFFGEPVEGNEFQPEFSFYLFRVESVTETTVTYRVLPEDGQENAVAHLGANLVTTVDDARGVMIQTLIADVGATFQIQPPSPFSPSTPLGLAPGAYRAVGNDHGNIVYEYSANGQHNLIGRDLRIDVTIASITAGAGSNVEPVDGNFGVRTSPVINGAPSDDVDYGANSDASHDAHA